MFGVIELLARADDDLLSSFLRLVETAPLVGFEVPWLVGFDGFGLLKHEASGTPVGLFPSSLSTGNPSEMTRMVGPPWTMILLSTFVVT